MINYIQIMIEFYKLVYFQFNNQLNLFTNCILLFLLIFSEYCNSQLGCVGFLIYDGCYLKGACPELSPFDGADFYQRAGRSITYV